LALTSDLSSYVPYTGATTNVDLGLFSLTSNSIKVIGDNSTYGGTLSIKQSNVTSLIGVGYTELFGKTNRLGISFGAGSIALLSNSILTAERTYTLPDATGTLALTSDIPVNPITGTGTSGQVAYFNGTSSITSNATFAFTPTSQLLVNNSVTAASAIARGTNLTPTLTAAANNDVLVGLDINPTFTNGAFTNLTNLGLRVQGDAQITRYITTGVASQSHYLELISPTSTNGYVNFRRGGGLNGTTAYQLSNHGGTPNAQFSYNAGTGETLLTTTNFLTFATGSTTGMQMFTTTRNVVLQNGGTFTDAGFRLDVNGTARVQGNTTVSLNQNANTNLNVFNTTAGNQSRAEIVTTSDANSGIFSFGKYSSTTTAFKTVTSGSAYLYNGVTAGNISILNDFASGNINFAAGGSSTAQATLFSTGNFAIGTGTDVASAVLQATSTTKGFLPPRMTSAQRTAISSPATGLIVYQTDGVEGLWLRTSTGWVELTVV
jgi:hypothetical protein